MWARADHRKAKNLGFAETGASESSDFEKTKELVMNELKNLFKPEFLNRVDDIIVFHKLNKENTLQIAEKMLSSLQNKLREMEITIEFTPEAVSAVADKGYDPIYGARPLRRVIQSSIEDTISEKDAGRHYCYRKEVSMLF